MEGQNILSLNQIHKDIKKEYKSLKNRIQSILLDNSFLKQSVVPRFPSLPLIPNQRCGLWYCEPTDFEATSYFKSTDGHINIWDFSTRRLNFHLLPIIAENNGMIIVDSTRRGKTMPDALSKTVPIWCAVLNSVMLESQFGKIDRKVLFLPPNILSRSECDRIARRIPDLVEKLKQINAIDGKKLYEQLGGCILRPFWIFPGSSLLQATTDPFTGEVVQEVWQTPKNEQILPVFLCTVSYKSQDGVDKRRGFTYVQGAADDHELWSCGLTPQMLWENLDYLGNANKSDGELSTYVSEMLAQKGKEVDSSELCNVFPYIEGITTELSLGKIVDGAVLNENIIEDLRNSFSLVIILSKNTKVPTKNDETIKFVKLYQLQSGCKRSSKDLRVQLSDIQNFIAEQLLSDATHKPALICCNSATDISVGVLLAVLCKNYLLDWHLGVPPGASKILIRKHLIKLITHLGTWNINPSRATLNSVNSYLMS